MPYPPNILNIAYHLADDVQKQIKPHRFVFEPTKKGSGFHYKVPDGKPKVIAWAYVYKRRPCLAVSIICDLLGTDPIVSKLVRRPNASWGQSGRDECQGVTYKVNDQGYHVVLHALVMAAKKCL